MGIYDKVFHLSHNDLDGYASQYAMTFSKEDVIYFNTSYEDLNENINKIFKEILNDRKLKTLFLITDVSLDIDAVTKINNFKRGNKDINIEFQLLDHHKSNGDLSTTNDWYLFNNDKCATLLTCEYVIKKFKVSHKEKKYLEYLGDFVDSHDRWLETHKYHNKANFLSDIIFNLFNFPDFLNEYKRDYVFFLIGKVTKIFRETFFSKIFNNNTIENCELKLNKITKTYLKNKIPNIILNDKNLKLSNKMIFLFTTLYEKLDTKIYYIKVDNKIWTFKVFYDLNSTIFQYLSHYYLERNNNINFMISVKSSGSLSFRSKIEEYDVSYLAKTYFNGGGHMCASGGNTKMYGEVKTLQDFEKILKTKLNVEILTK